MLILDPREFLRLLKLALAGWWNDRALSLGASIAFFTSFSLAPMLLTVIAVAGLAFGREAAQGAIVAELSSLLGLRAAAMIEQMIASASDLESGLIGTIVGFTTFLVLLTGAVVELQDDLNIIWKVPPPKRYGVVDFLRTRVLSIALVLVCSFVLLVSLIIDAGLSALGSYLEARYSGARTALQAMNNVAAFAVSSALFATILKILPNIRLAWQDVWTGALLTGALFTGGKFLIGWYLGTSDIPAAYGAAASLITIQLWIYYSALILLFGAEFTKVYAESRGTRRGMARTPLSEAAP